MCDDVCTICVPSEQAAVFRQLAVPVLRNHGWDDVLPACPEELLVWRYLLLRLPASGVDGDAACNFSQKLAASKPVDGLVVLARHSANTLLLPTAAARFPWHPLAQRFTPRGCSVSAAEVQEAAARQAQQQQTAQLHQQSQRQLACQQQQQQRGTVPLAMLALHADHAFLQDLAAAVVQHNRRVEAEQQEQADTQAGEQQHAAPSSQELARRQQLLQQRVLGSESAQQQTQQLPRMLATPLLLQTVQRAAAAALIQSCWRAHSCRLVHRVAEQALLNRAARVVQRAWRALVLRQRLQLLACVSSAWQSGRRLRFSSVMCVDVAGRRLLEAAADRGRLGAGLFPEHRLRFVINAEGSVLLVDVTQHTSSGGGSMSSTSAAARVGLPHWLGIDAPIISAAEAAVLLEDQLWFEPFSRADAGKLLEIGCDTKDLLAPSLVAQPGQLHPTEVAQLVTFKSPQEAAVRSALLAALTYDVRARAGCRLLSVQDSPLGDAYRSMTQRSSGSSNAAKAAAGPAEASTAAAAGGKRGAARGNDKRVKPAGLKPTDGEGAGAQVHHAGGEGSKGMERAAAAKEAAAAMAVAKAALEDVAAAGPFYKLPLQPVVPTGTLAAACTDDTQPLATASGSLKFQTHVFHKLPHLTMLAAAEAAAGVPAGQAGTAGSSAVAPAQHSSTSRPPAAAPLDAAGDAAAQLLNGVPGQGSSPDGSGLAVSCVAALAASAAAYIQQLKLTEAEAMRADRAANAAVAAADAEAELAAKQQAVAAARAAAADSSVSSQAVSQHTSCGNCNAPGYWPATTADAAAASQAVRQQLQHEAAQAAQGVRQREAESRGALLQQQAAARASAQQAAQHDTQALQGQLLQQEDQQQQAATSRASGLRQIRAAGASAVRRRQQLAGAAARQTNLFSKHLKHGEVAVVRAAGQQAATSHVRTLQQSNTEAALLALQKQEEMGSSMAAKARQEADEAKLALSAASAVEQTEQAARRARAAAQRLREQDMVSTVGPAGGERGSANPAAALKLPLRTTLVGDLAANIRSAD